MLNWYYVCGVIVDLTILADKMDVSDDELDKMYNWINNSMKVNTWYPVKTDKAYEIIIRLFNEGLIGFCEFDHNQTHFRKIDIDLLEDN